MIKHGYKQRYAYGGTGIFDTITNLLLRVFSSNIGKTISSSAVDIGKNLAKKGAKSVLDVGVSAASDVGKKLVKKALTPKSKKILQKYTTKTTPKSNMSSIVDGSSVEIQNLVKKLHNGMGIKKIYFFNLKK